MNRGIVLAWLAGLGILTYEDIRIYRKPPVPGRILGASAVFAALAVVAEYDPARTAATLAAWGFDLAVLFLAIHNKAVPARSGRAAREARPA